MRAGFSGDIDRLSRFQREGKLLAALNHPNVAQIYGVVGSDSTHGIVMELVEGDTLHVRLELGPLPLDGALQIAKQVLDALEAAHEQGIVHRDLKPGNIMVSADGKVKVLDFGLAKAMAPHGAGDDLSRPPTIFSGPHTEANVMLGTAAYMSPAQVRGRVADERSDVWAFGCVLYEMLTGQQPFTGETVTDLMGGILRVEPDWKPLPAKTPPAVRSLLERCLQKDRRQRYQAIGDVRFDFDRALRAPENVAAAPTTRERIAWTGAAVFALAAIGAPLATRYFAARPAEPVTSRFLIPLPSDAPIGPAFVDPEPSVSPDGRFVAFRTGAS
jgi:serine/threonine protein kinase